MFLRWPSADEYVRLLVYRAWCITCGYGVRKGPSSTGRTYQTAMLSSLLPPSGFTGVGTTQPYSAIGMRIATEHEIAWASDVYQNSQYQSQPATTGTRQARLHKTGV